MSERLQFSEFPMPSEHREFADAIRMLEERPTPKNNEQEMIIRLPHKPTYADLTYIRDTLFFGPEYGLDYKEGQWYLTKGRQSAIGSIEDAPWPRESIGFHTHPHIKQSWSGHNMKQHQEMLPAQPYPSIIDAASAMIEHPSINWGIISETCLTLYKFKGRQLGDRLSKYSELIEYLQHQANWLYYNDPEFSRTLYTRNDDEIFAQAVIKASDLQICTIPWGDEARTYWETLPDSDV